VWRHSCRPIGSSPASLHAVRARRVMIMSECIALPPERPNRSASAADGLSRRRRRGGRAAVPRVAPSFGSALRLDGPYLRVPAALDTDDTTLEVDVAPTKRRELSAAQAGVEGGRPHSPVLLREPIDERSGLRRPGDPFAPPPHDSSAASLGRALPPQPGRSLPSMCASSALSRSSSRLVASIRTPTNPS